MSGGKKRRDKKKHHKKHEKKYDDEPREEEEVEENEVEVAEVEVIDFGLIINELVEKWRGTDSATEEDEDGIFLPSSAIVYEYSVTVTNEDGHEVAIIPLGEAPSAVKSFGDVIRFVNERVRTLKPTEYAKKPEMLGYIPEVSNLPVEVRNVDGASFAVVRLDKSVVDVVDNPDLPSNTSTEDRVHVLYVVEPGEGYDFRNAVFVSVNTFIQLVENSESETSGDVMIGGQVFRVFAEEELEDGQIAINEMYRNKYGFAIDEKVGVTSFPEMDEACDNLHITVPRKFPALTPAFKEVVTKWIAKNLDMVTFIGEQVAYFKDDDAYYVLKLATPCEGAVTIDTSSTKIELSRPERERK